MSAWMLTKFLSSIFPPRICLEVRGFFHLFCVTFSSILKSSFRSKHFYQFIFDLLLLRPDSSGLLLRHTLNSVWVLAHLLYFCSFWVSFVQAITSCFLIDGVKQISRWKSLSEISKSSDSSGLFSFSRFDIILYVFLGQEEGLSAWYGQKFWGFGTDCVPGERAGQQLWVGSKGELASKNLAKEPWEANNNLKHEIFGGRWTQELDLFQDFQARLTLASRFWRQSQGY